MADKSKIEWTDATVNFWWGCTKVSPACDHCYAEAWDKRMGGDHWGSGVPRRKIKGAVETLHRLDNGYAGWAADREVAVGNAMAFGLPAPTTGIRRGVFIQSMSDLFDNEVPLEWFAEAWETITACDRLDLRILTKRISAVEKRLAAIGAEEWPRHAGLMITVIDQPEADRDILRLLDLKAKLNIPWVGLSIEPMLGPVDFDGMWVDHPDSRMHINMLECLVWIIVDGESGPGARPMHPDWARSLRDQALAAGVPFFFKQWGEWAPAGNPEATHMIRRDSGHVIDWARPEQNCDAVWSGVRRIGKKAAGRLLDGREWNQMPVPAAGATTTENTP